MAENAFKADWPSFALGFNTGKSKGGGTPEGFHMVRFFNDDRTTLLYTVFVPTGANAMYAGETPISATGGAIFRGFEPVATNITADLDCYAVYEGVGTLDETSWADISVLSANGIAQNYFSVGDTKMIHIEGIMGAASIASDYYVYIIGFDHNEELEGKGIHFGTFKKNGNSNACLGNSSGSSTTGSKSTNMNHWGGYNHGGWAGCDLRYDVLGSTDKAPSGYGSTAKSGRTGYDASATCAIAPKSNTLIAAFPYDLRSVMKPMTKYTDGKGGSTNTEENVVATIDYLPLLAEFEVFGESTNANPYEKNKQKQYDYFAAGNSKTKQLGTSGTNCPWWLRSAYKSGETGFCSVGANGKAFGHVANSTIGIAPIFKV